MRVVLADVGHARLGEAHELARVDEDRVLVVAGGAWVQGLLGAWGAFRRYDVVVAVLPSGIALAANTAAT